MQRLLQGVAATSDDLLKNCIRAREDLGAAKTRILRARERDREAREAVRGRTTPAHAMMMMPKADDGRWGERGGGSSGDGGGGGAGWGGSAAVERGEAGEEEMAAMAAALPPAREFADKMAELAAVVPGLSKSLVDLTAVRLACIHRIPFLSIPGCWVLSFVPRLLR